MEGVTPISVNLELNDSEMKILVRKAVIGNFYREDPRKRWSDKERKDAARFAIRNLVNEYLLQSKEVVT